MTLNLQKQVKNEQINKPPFLEFARNYIQKFEKIQHSKESKSGKRIGLYKIGRDIGIGNFSSVRLGVHTLSKGENMVFMKGLKHFPHNYSTINISFSRFIFK